MASAKILVVDDDPAIRNLISRYLSQQDYQVDTAGDGHSALERFEQFNPDLVVLDLGKLSYTFKIIKLIIELLFSHLVINLKLI